jgi:hypothetical protein
MPYVVIGTKVSRGVFSAGVALAGLPYFTVWLSTVDMAAVQRNIYYPWIHGTSGSVVTAFVERIQIASFSLMGN